MTEKTIAQQATDVMWQYVSASWPSKFHVLIGQGTFDESLLANSVTAPEWHQSDELSLLVWEVENFIASCEDDADGTDRFDGLFAPKAMVQGLPELERELLKLLWHLVDARVVATRYLEEYKDRYRRELKINKGALGDYAQNVVAECVVREHEYEKVRRTAKARAKRHVEIALTTHLRGN